MSSAARFRAVEDGETVFSGVVDECEILLDGDMFKAILKFRKYR